MVNRWGSFKKIFISRKIVENPFGLVEAFGKGEKKVSGEAINSVLPLSGPSSFRHRCRLVLAFA